MSISLNETIEGIPASPGIAIGPAFLYGKEDFVIYRRKIKDADIPREIARFEDALINTRKELTDLKDSLASKGAANTKIFDAHLLLLEDRMLIEEVISRLKEEKFCVEYIFSQVIKKYIEAFSQMSDDYIRERTSDVSDIGRRILRNLLGHKKGFLLLNEPAIVVAHDLSPSDTAAMSKTNLLGFITDIGGKTSHTAILAKSLEIPAIVGAGIATRVIRPNDLLIIDGYSGLVIINPDTHKLRDYKQKKTRTINREKRLDDLKSLPAETQDGHKVVVAANIEFPYEVDSVISHGAEGIGLFRTEFLFMNKEDLATEQEQFEIYKQAAEKVAPNPVIIRTMDVGGDKFISPVDMPDEMHPFLGWRAIRFCLARPEIFKTQLRAILRASAYGNIKIMYPMISCVEEIRDANALLEEAKKELKKKRQKFNANIEIGAMIEVPSAAISSDIIAKEVSFFSIGTNDLVQYTLAVDRANEKVAYLYEPTHPAVLRLIKMTIDNAHKNKIWVGMCGEMAGDLELVLLLLGMGLDEFSVPPIAVPKIKYIIRHTTLESAKEVARETLRLASPAKIQAFLKQKTDPFLKAL